MARILVNYYYNSAKDEFKIGSPDWVLADQRVAVLETEEIIKKPLVVPIRGAFTVVDWDKYAVDHKRFYLVANEKGEISEAPNGAPVWLPKNTDVSKLRLVNGQIVSVQDEPQEGKAAKSSKGKKENKKEEEKAN